MSAQVHDSEDDDLVTLDSVEQAVGESVDQSTTNARAENWPALGTLANVLDRSVDLVQEPVAEAGNSRFVEVRRGDELLLGGV